MDFTHLATKDTLERTTQALTKKGYQVTLLSSKGDALEFLKKNISPQSSIMHGASVTLEQIGFVEYLKSDEHPWIDLKKEINQEQDPIQRGLLRRKSALSDYYLGSVHALTETGDFVIASNTGSQLPGIVFTATHLIFVISTKKIVPNLDIAMQRLTEYVVPLENKHMHDLYGTGTAMNKIVFFRGEAPALKRTIQVLLIEEDLGF